MSKWQYLLQAPPNEIGDTLAGVAGSLAFIWVVVAVLFQATELREQREEFERMADAQSAQAISLRVQAQLFKDEQRQRKEQEACELLEEASKQLVRCFYEADLDHLSWWKGKRAADVLGEKFLEHGYVKGSGKDEGDRILALLTELFGNAVVKLRRVDQKGELHGKPDLPQALAQLRRYLQLIVECQDGLPPAKAEGLREFQMDQASKYLDALLTEPYWEEPMELDT